MMHHFAPEMERPKTSKHMMERKRRARINDSLLQLKSLIFPAIRKEMSRQPKMEKADILEMTVRYLKEVQSSAQSGRASPSAQVSQYHAGFNECLGEASSFLSNCESIDLDTRLRIMNHLADRCSNLPEPSSAPAAATQQQQQHQQQHGSYSYHSNGSSTLSQQHPTAISPAPVMANCNINTRVPSVTYVPHTVQQHPQQQQLMLCIPQDFASQTNSSLLSQSSTQSSIIFPTPPPSPVEVTSKPAQQYAHLPTEYRYKAKSAIAASYRRHNGVISHTVSQENVWRPW